MLPFSTHMLRSFMHVLLTSFIQQSFKLSIYFNCDRVLHVSLTKMSCKNSLLNKSRTNIINLLEVWSETLNKFWIEFCILDFAFLEFHSLKTAPHCSYVNIKYQYFVFVRVCGCDVVWKVNCEDFKLP